MLGLANAYLHMWSKLEYVDFWYSVPVETDSDRIQSQRWHRDFDDRHLLKAFLYLVDVDEQHRPVRVRRRQRPGTNEPPTSTRGTREAPPTRRTGSSTQPSTRRTSRRSRPAPATLILCNTSGFHRGGFATAKPRVLATATYCSPASLASLTERNYRLPKGAQKSLSAVQRHAVS